MIQASVCTIGDEILIGQITDTNSAAIAAALNMSGIKVRDMSSIGDDREQIISSLRNELEQSEIVITTGGLGPTKDDITKGALAELSGSTGTYEDATQMEIIHRLLSSRGLDVLDVNRAQACVPDSCTVIPNRLGTAPIMVFDFPAGTVASHRSTLYALPGVPFEAEGAIPDVLEDIGRRWERETIIHESIMTYGLAESALASLIAPWEDSLPEDMHLAYLPNQLTGVRLRLSMYSDAAEDGKSRIRAEFERLKGILGDLVYSDRDDTLQDTIGRLLKGTSQTLSAAESCTGGKISSLLTSVPGSSEYYLGSVTSYAVAVKESVLGVAPSVIEEHGVVSSEVAAAMAEGVRKLTGSTWSVSTTGLAGPSGDGVNPVGTVWIGVAGPDGTTTVRKQYGNDRIRNVERFAATALNELRKRIVKYSERAGN